VNNPEPGRTTARGRIRSAAGWRRGNRSVGAFDAETRDLHVEASEAFAFSIYIDGFAPTGTPR
jgi:hypothetical protein